MRAILLAGGLLFLVGTAMTSQNALAEDRQMKMRVECDPGYHWNGSECVRNKERDRGERDRDVKCDEGYHWDRERKRCVSN